MNELARADIFFTITAVAVVILGVLAAVILIYLIRILEDLRRIAALAKEETLHVVEDLEELRTNMKKEGTGWERMRRFMSVAYGIYKRRRRG